MSSKTPEQEIDHFFRHQSGKMVAILTRIFGAGRIDLAEEVVQDALVRALELWPFEGVPEQPAAWLMTVARNRALDIIRRETAFASRVPDLLQSFERETAEPARARIFTNDEICLLFLCCHPALPPISRVALALKMVAGLSAREIARAFLTSETTIAQRLVRGKRQIRDERLSFDLPEAVGIQERIDSVLETIYLIFNEGYTANSGEMLIRADLCNEAINIVRALVTTPETATPKTHALAALLLLQQSRGIARSDEGGNLCLLREQDRSRWDQALIREGLAHLSLAANGEELSIYHPQAAIAAAHALAPSFEATDWQYIVDQYDDLYRMNPSPVVVLNRAIAIAEVAGPQAGLSSLEPIASHPLLFQYHLLHAVTGELCRKLGQEAEARAAYQRALDCPSTEPERRYVLKQLSSLELV